MVELLIDQQARTRPRVIVRKHMADTEALAHQVRWLTRAQGPGVARIHHIDGKARHYSTGYAGPITLAGLGDNPAPVRAAVWGLWAALERLHRIGLVHRALSADHIVVGNQGPVLISPGDPDGGDRHTDIAGLGVMLTGRADLWAARGRVADEIIDRWSDAGERLIALTTSAGYVSGAAVRHVLDELPVEASGRLERRLRRWRYGSGRDRRDGPPPSRP